MGNKNQSKKKEGEFFTAFSWLGSCVATLRCGCSIEEDERLYMDSLRRMCREYIDAYQWRELEDIERAGRG